MVSLRKDKDFFDRRIDGTGNIDGEFQGRIVLGFFQAHDGFATHTDFIGELFLSPAFGETIVFQAAFKFSTHGLVHPFVAVEKVVAEKDREAVDERNGGEHEDGTPLDVAVEETHAHEPDDDKKQRKTNAVGFEFSAAAVFLEKFVFKGVGELAFEEEAKKSEKNEEDKRKNFPAGGVSPKSSETKESTESQPAETW